MSTIHATLTPGGLGDKCKAEPSTEPFLKQQPFTPKTAGDAETNVQTVWGSKKPFGRRKPFAQRTPDNKRDILPQDVYYG